MKTFLVSLALFASASAFATEANQTQRKLMCNELVGAGQLERWELNICVQEYEVSVLRKTALSTTLGLYVQQILPDGQGGELSVYKVCELRYKGTARSPVIARNGLKCRIH